jgi:hypothetical protein
LDISFGVETINEPTPPVVIAGRLHMESGGSLILEDLGMPLARFVESGDATLNALHDSGLVRTSSLPEHNSSYSLATGEDVLLTPQQSV